MWKVAGQSCVQGISLHALYSLQSLPSSLVKVSLSSAGMIDQPYLLVLCCLVTCVGSILTQIWIQMTGVLRPQKEMGIQFDLEHSESHILFWGASRWLGRSVSGQFQECIV